MPVLSAPTVWEPLYECAPAVVVTGYVPGAAIDIYAKLGAAPADHIGGGVSNSASGQVFGVNVAKMVVGAKVYATQAFGGSTSPPSPSITLQKPLSVDAPVLSPPLWDCARCVRVDGMLPGARAEVREGAASLGLGTAYWNPAHVGVNPPLVGGHKITARQVHCGTPGPSSPDATVGNTRELKNLLSPPEVAEPLYACQQYCEVQGCMPGADVELFVDGAPAGAQCCPATGVTFWIPGGLQQGKSITARQSLCGGAIQTGVSPAAVVQSASAIPQPVIWPPLYEGDTSVMIAMTVSGEVVTIDADGTPVGMGGAGGGTVSLNVTALVAGQSVVATVELCGVHKSSPPVEVLPRPKTVPPPTVVKPLTACSMLVLVKDCVPGADVRVFAQSGGSTVLLGKAPAIGSAVLVGEAPPLKAGWKITATQEVGGLVSAASGFVTVQAAAAPAVPKLATPIYQCSRCVRVQQTTPGARIDVYQDGVWMGSANATGPTTEVGVYPGLALNAAITATQTICGKVSKLAKATTTRAERKLGAPKIAGAYAGHASVDVTDVVPGSIVEIEEVLIYQGIIGQACVTSTSASVGVGLPLFLGARVRARQKLCTSSSYSAAVDVSPPPEWPLGAGPYKAGFRLVADVPVGSTTYLGSSDQCNGGFYDYVVPATNKAVIYYPAAAEGQNAGFVGGGPFPLIVYGHGRRRPACVPNWQVCAGAPPDTTDDYRQLSGILAHLARWGFIAVGVDLSWAAGDFSTPNWQAVMTAAASYAIAESTRSGSPFQGKIRTTGIGLMGHSSSGTAVPHVATSGLFSVDALALVAPFHGDNEVTNFAPKPALVIHGTNDTGAFGGQGASNYAAAAPTKYLVTIDGANHYGYTDALCILADPSATIAQADQQKIAKAYITAFFRRYLLGALEIQDYLTGVHPVEELESFGITVDAQIA